MVDQLTGGAVQPEEVHLSHRQPADKVPYARYLNVPVRFNEHRVCLILRASARPPGFPAPITAPPGRAGKLRETLWSGRR